VNPVECVCGYLKHHTIPNYCPAHLSDLADRDRCDLRSMQRRRTPVRVASKQKFAALSCANDEMAIAAIVTLKMPGMRVPEEVSVVGFDDMRFARYCDPMLTTIAQPKNQLGGEATVAPIHLSIARPVLDCCGSIVYDYMLGLPLSGK
jgi:hypothetical protein